MTSVALVTATQCKGTVLIHEKLFESRLFFVDGLLEMGARIILCDPHRAVILGSDKLRAAKLASPDIRAGMALLIAALCAEGESEIRNITQIDRGFSRIEEYDFSPSAPKLSADKGTYSSAIRTLSRFRKQFTRGRDTLLLSLRLRNPPDQIHTPPTS